MGYLIPKGAGILNNVYTIHHDPKRFPDQGGSTQIATRTTANPCTKQQAILILQNATHSRSGQVEGYAQACMLLKEAYSLAFRACCGHLIFSLLLTRRLGKF
jgi:hypothetical protein